MPGVTGRWQKVIIGAGVVALLAALVVAAPGWWWRLVSHVGAGLLRFWISALLALVGVAALGWATTKRRRPAGNGNDRRRQALADRLPLGAHLGMLLTLAVVIAIGVGWLLWLGLGRPAVRPTATATWTPQNTFDALKVVLGVVGAIGAVVALTVAYRRQHIGEAAERREDTRLFTDRFRQASEQLGSDKAAVRLAGVYAMASLADDWDDERQTCIDVLCAYLLMPYTPPSNDEPDPEGLSSEEIKEARKELLEARQERQVRHTVIRLIAQHLTPYRATSWHGNHFDLTGAVFDGGDLGGIEVSENTSMHLGGAVFSGGEVSFYGARFSGGWVSFDGARFSGGEVSFNDAEFSRGWVSFEGAEFSGGRVSFRDAGFSGGWVSFNYARFSGGEVSFHDARFSGGEVSFHNAVFSGGIVDLEHPGRWSKPPTFDNWSGGPPPGLRLPSPRTNSVPSQPD